MLKNYYIQLIDRVFNVLYTYENNKGDFTPYVKTLVEELSGNEDFEEIYRIRFKLNSLVLNECSHSDVRKAVLKSISLLDKILSNWGV